MLLPPINDLEVREVIRALHEAAPELPTRAQHADPQSACGHACVAASTHEPVDPSSRSTQVGNRSTRFKVPAISRASTSLEMG